MKTTVTKAGDGGETSLLDGSRVPKTSAPIEALGLADEAQAALGLARALAQNPAVREELRRAEVALAALMGDLADPRGPARLGADDVRAIERAAEALVAPLPDGFALDLPGANPSSAQLHVARTVVRRCERGLWRLREAGEDAGRPASDVALTYLNRLSDLCFACALVEARA